MTSFPAYVATKTNEGQSINRTELTERDLMDGGVTVKVEYSALNYKDGLAMTNSAPIIRRYPLVPGIDFAGTVVSSTDDRFESGDRVVLNGFGVGEYHSGGFAGLARVNSDWLVRLPDTISCPSQKFVQVDILDLFQESRQSEIFGHRCCQRAFRIMNTIICALLAFMSALFRSRFTLQLEIVALRHQLTVYRRTTQRPRINPGDRIFWSWCPGPAKVYSHGGPGTPVYNSVMGQCDHMEYRRHRPF